MKVRAMLDVYNTENKLVSCVNKGIARYFAHTLTHLDLANHHVDRKSDCENG